MRTFKTAFLLLTVVLGLSVMFGFSRVLADTSSANAYELIDHDLEPFRTDFNAASDHVRAVLLVGPT